MPCDYSKYPSNWKTEIRPAIMKRANNCCEFCGVKHYSVGNRNGENFTPTAGNIKHDAAGNGELSYKEARELVTQNNELSDGNNLIVIVLTIAHLDHDVNNNDFTNLKALCQRCHNRHDIVFRKKNRKNNRLGELF